ncbi:MAG TPA: hypothetical protein VN025_02185 [Candidatus Dormibacteraeota bacterium]|jgi:hypothetical protein|nr:hypothetical protein [Candidatus Dormibacteraeota bacterium]
MNIFLFVTGFLIVGLLGLLAWSVGNKRIASNKTRHRERDNNINLVCKHLTNLTQIRQALEPADIQYIHERLCRSTARNMRRERRHIACRFLDGLREDFHHLMETAQFVAAFSPKVEAKEEWKRFLLKMEFECKYRLLRMKFALGSSAFGPMDKLAIMISSLAMDLERAVNEIGAAAMVAANQSSAGR